MEEKTCYYVLKVLRALYRRFFGKVPTQLTKEYNPEKASDLIYRLLAQEKPCMIARFGAIELSTVVNYLSVRQTKHSVWRFIKDMEPQWWWDLDLISHMQSNAGFFPATIDKICQFSELILQDIKEVDVLASWRHDEVYVKDRLEKTDMISLPLLEPYWSQRPWTRVLEDKHVLVVHPFADDIVNQYNNNRDKLFRDKNVLPKFASLRVVKAVQSIGGGDNLEYKDWFEALSWMEGQMDKEIYDIALIGCGAYGFPLAAHAKRTGHKAVHMGGALQLLFGIRGKRWDYNNSIEEFDYSTLPNEYWIRPDASTKTTFTAKVEGGCYW